MATDYFWENIEQAAQRLNNSIILYDERPCFVAEVRPHVDGTPRAHIRMIPDEVPGATKALNSPKFGKFRQSVPLGFINEYFGGRVKTCSFIERQTTRTVVHGLTDSNTRVMRFYANGQFDHEYRIRDFVNSRAFLDMAIGNYPTFKEAVDGLVPNATVGIHRKYALANDSNDGKLKLYRERAMIGYVPDNNTVLLVKEKRHWKEELLDFCGFMHSFKGLNVREF